MRGYKLVACDLDGTLIGTDMKLSDVNRRAIRDLTDQGVIVVPITGRTLCEMEEVAALPEIRYIIYSNGAVIYDKETGEKIILGLKGDLARFVFDVLRPYDALTVIHKDGRTYADYKKAQDMDYYHMSRNVKDMVSRKCVLEEEWEKRFFDGEIECAATFFANRADCDACREKLATNPALYAAAAWDYNLEIFFNGAGKDNALTILMQRLGLEPAEVISVGDSDNDRKMTLLAGLGLAVSNASEEMKEIADRVICSNDEHVMDYIKRHFFIREKEN